MGEAESEAAGAMIGTVWGGAAVGSRRISSVLAGCDILTMMKKMGVRAASAANVCRGEMQEFRGNVENDDAKPRRS